MIRALKRTLGWLTRSGKEVCEKTSKTSQEYDSTLVLCEYSLKESTVKEAFNKVEKIPALWMLASLPSHSRTWSRCSWTKWPRCQGRSQCISQQPRYPSLHWLFLSAQSIRRGSQPLPGWGTTPQGPAHYLVVAWFHCTPSFMKAAVIFLFRLNTLNLDLDLFTVLLTAIYPYN